MRWLLIIRLLQQSTRCCAKTKSAPLELAVCLSNRIIRRWLEGSRWRLRRARGMRLAMGFEWGLFSPFVRAQAQMQALLMLRRSEADATSYVADYLTRSVRRASGSFLPTTREVPWSS